MGSLLGNPSIHHSDNLVGHVLPRVSVDRSQTSQMAVGFTLPNLDASKRANAPMVDSFIPRASRDERQTTNVATGDFLWLDSTTRSAPQPASLKSEKAETTNYYHTAERRQQCRTNQARYRHRQRIAHLQLEKSVEHLRQEVDTLKRRYRDLSSRERSNQSPWSIVTEVFRLLESSFRSPWRIANVRGMQKHPITRQSLAVLERSFAQDAAMGELSGSNVLMDQLRRYSQHFGEPALKLQTIESMASGVLAAKSSLSVTVTELTLRHIFAHPEKSNGGTTGTNELHRLLCDRLLGKRLQMWCSMRFLFDEENDRVVRLETKIDLVTALLRVLWSLNDVSSVLEHALISPECIVGGNLTR